MNSMSIKLLILMLAMVFMTACSNGNSSNSSSEAANVDFPERDIEIIVPYAPGGLTDLAARNLSSVVSEYIPNGVNVNVINKPGGGGTIGTMDIYNADDEGYKIGMTTIGPMTIKPFTDNTAYTPESFKPILQVVATPNVLLVHEDAPWETYEEWFEYVSNNPGEFSYGTPGTGSIPHITMEAFGLETGVELTQVPFEGNSPAVAALLGGHVEGVVVQTTDALTHTQEGTLRALVNTGTEKSEGFEDVPLLTELGVDVEFDVWTGLIANGDTPDEIVTILHDAFKQALEDERVIETFAKLGATTSYESSSDFAEIMKSDYEYIGGVLKSIGMAE